MLVYVCMLFMHYADASVRQFAKDVTPLVKQRIHALTKEPGEYKFSRFRPTFEGDFETMLIHNAFIDKSSAYKRLFIGSGEGMPSYHVKFPRRFGKTTLLTFLRSTLSLQASEIPSETKYTHFLQALTTLDEGKFFIQQKLSPSVRIDFGNVSDIFGARRALRKAFRRAGVEITVDDKSTCSDILNQGIDGLNMLWTDAVKQFPQYVSEKVILMIDEYDYPFRYRLLTLLEEGEKDMQNVGKCPKELEEITLLTQEIKTLHGETRILMSVFVTLLSLADIGLTHLETTNVAHQAEFHGVVGITLSQVGKAFSRLDGERSLVQDAYALQRAKEDYGEMISHIACSVHDALTYFVVRYNGHQFCVCRTTEEIQNLEPLAAPCDVYHFFYYLGLRSVWQDSWASSWGDRHRDLLFAMTEKDQNVLDPLLGGTLSKADITGNVSFQKCYHRQLGFLSLVRLFLEYGYLRIAKVYGKEEDKRFILVPCSSLEIGPAEKDIRENLQKNARLVHKLDSGTLKSLQMPKQYGEPIKEDTFDFHLFWQLYFAKENICNFTSKGYADVVREYETQFFTIVQLRSHWLHDDVTITSEEKKEEEDRGSGCIRTVLRLDILIQVSKRLAACLELKIMHGSYNAHEIKAKHLMNIAWGQALRHSTSPAIATTAHKVFYAVVYCIGDEGNVEVLVRRGAAEAQQEEFLISRMPPVGPQSHVMVLQKPFLRRSKRPRDPDTIHIEHVTNYSA